MKYVSKNESLSLPEGELFLTLIILWFDELASALAATEPHLSTDLPLLEDMPNVLGRIERGEPTTRAFKGIETG